MTSSRPKSEFNGRGLMVMALAALWLPSCAVEQSVTVKPPSADGAEEIVEPVVRGGHSGLEMRRWVIRDRGEDLAEALSPYSDSLAELSVEERRHLQVNGFRLVRVPLTELPGVRESLELTGRIDRHWFGQSPDWTDAMVGLDVGEGLAMRSSGGVSVLDGGRLRLLLRAWTTPTADGPRLRVDLALQLAFAAESAAFSLPERRPVAEDGPLFDDLSVSALLEPGNAYLICSERPEVPWGEGDSIEVIAQDAEDGFGPASLRTETAGELMLSERVVDDDRKRVYRQVVVLLPRLPERFRLIE